MTGWATAADVLAVTGSSPIAAPPATSTGDGTLALAQSMIEDHVNRTPAADGGMRTRDLYWLKKAVAWQTVWLPSQPGVLSRVGTTGVSQDGLNATYNSAADILVAPLAQRALKNLSWMGTRSLRIGSRRPRIQDGSYVASTAAFLNSGADPEYAGWEPY